MFTNRMTRLATLPTALAMAVTVQAAVMTIDWHTIDGGGQMFCTDGQPDGLELSGTIGQPDAGVMTGGDLELTGGFWAASAPSSVPLCVCGDLDGSGGPVDLLDFATFAVCFNLTAPEGDCTAADIACADLSGDGQVNLLDFATFAAWYGQQTTQTAPDCGQ